MFMSIMNLNITETKCYYIKLCLLWFYISIFVDQYLIIWLALCMMFRIKENPLKKQQLFPPVSTCICESAHAGKKAISYLRFPAQVVDTQYLHPCCPSQSHKQYPIDHQHKSPQDPLLRCSPWYLESALDCSHILCQLHMYDCLIYYIYWTIQRQYRSSILRVRNLQEEFSFEQSQLFMPPWL